MNEKFVVIMVRKSDGATFISDSQKPVLMELVYTAMSEAERKARECSTDYVYTVCKVVPIADVEKEETPVKITKYGHIPF